VHPSRQDPDSDKASPKAFSKGSSVSQLAHNQNHEVAHSTNVMPPPRYANPSVNRQTMCVRTAAGHSSRHPETNKINADQCHFSVDTKEAEPAPQLTEDELIEQRRKKREAIKAKYRNQQQPLLKQALEQTTLSAPSTPQHESSGVTSEHASCESLTLEASHGHEALTDDRLAAPNSLESPRTPASPGSPADINVANDEELANRQQTDDMVNDDEGPSAADYDPTMEEDRPDHKPFANTAQENNNTKVFESVEKAPNPTKEFDMFAEDDDDDMFAPTGPDSKNIEHAEVRALDSSLLDNWDYPDGHYRIIIGELLDGRYAVQQQIGKGTFATVVKAHDTKTNQDVAVKIACNNETMYKAGTKEMDMLTLLNAEDPEDKKHVIRLLRNFDHKAHMCLVFENLHCDLREVLKKFGRNVGINLKAIRAYGRQMFLALSHMKKCEVLHADLKPDNILVNQERSQLKICDLGTASKARDAEVTPYLVSRFYRAPEVILGMPFDYAIDMWSIGCTLYELYTGRILFAGGDNNQMLRVIQECRGKFPKRVIIRSTLADKHFIGGDPEYVFVSQERDKITGNTTMKQMNFNKTTPGRDLRARLTANTRAMSPAELKEVHHFIDLLEKCLQLDPARRITPNDALRHPFIQHTQAAAATATKKMKPAMAPLERR
jgi:serine/threonine-protein kinase PRP4